MVLQELFLLYLFFFLEVIKIFSYKFRKLTGLLESRKLVPLFFMLSSPDEMKLSWMVFPCKFTKQNLSVIILSVFHLQWIMFLQLVSAPLCDIIRSGWVDFHMNDWLPRAILFECAVYYNFMCVDEFIYNLNLSIYKIYFYLFEYNFLCIFCMVKKRKESLLKILVINKINLI